MQPDTCSRFSGIDAPVLKSATVTSPVGSDGVCTFLPIRHNTVSTVRLAIEPLNPAELPRMVRCLGVETRIANFKP